MTSCSATLSTRETNVPEKKYNFSEGLTKMQKKNVRMRARAKIKKLEQEKKKEEQPVLNLPEDTDQPLREQILNDVTAKFKQMPNLSTLSREKVSEAYEKQKEEIADCLNTLNEAIINYCKKVPKVDTRQVTAQSLSALISKRIHEFGEDAEGISYLKEQYKLVKSYENARKARSSYEELIQKLQARLEYNEKFFQKNQQLGKVKSVAEKLYEIKKVKVDPHSIQLYSLRIPQDVTSSLFPRNSFLPKLERTFSVLAERQGQYDSTHYTIYGIENDLKDVISFFEEVDFSEKNHLTVPSQMISRLIGKNGETIIQLQNETKCLINIANDGNISIFGTRANVEKAINYLNVEIDSWKPSQNTATVEIKEPILLRGLHSPYFQRVFRGIELKNQSVKIKVNSQNSTIVIQGHNATEVEEATKEINEVLKETVIEKVTVPNSEVFQMLFKEITTAQSSNKQEAQSTNVIFKRNGVKIWSIQEKLNVLIDSLQNVAFVKTDDLILHVVCGASAKTIVLQRLQECFKYASEKSLVIEIPAYLRFALTPDYILSVEHNHNVKLERARRPVSQTSTEEKEKSEPGRRNRTQYFEMIGKQEDIQEAEQSIKDYLEKEGHIEDIEIQGDGTIRQLTKQSCSMLKELEDIYRISITLPSNHEDRIVQIVGSEENIQRVAKIIKDLDQRHAGKSANAKTVEIKIPNADIIKFVIGTKGEMIKNIRMESKIDFINIDREACTVKITGKEESCSKAEQMLQNIFTKHQKSQNSNESSFSINSKKTDTISNSQEQKSVISDINAFPALDEAVEMQTSETASRRYKRPTKKWKT